MWSPSRRDELLICLLEPGRRGDAAIGMTGAAFPVASLIKRKPNFGNAAPAFTQPRLYHVGRSAFETRQVRITLELQGVVESELRIPQGRGIPGHLSSPCCCRAGLLTPRVEDRLVGIEGG